MSKISSPLRRNKRRSPLRHDEGTGHMMMTREAHIKEHDGDVVAAGYEVGTKIEDVTTEVEKFQKNRYANIPPLSVETIEKLKKPDLSKSTLDVSFLHESVKTAEQKHDQTPTLSLEAYEKKKYEWFVDETIWEDDEDEVFKRDYYKTSDWEEYQQDWEQSGFYDPRLEALLKQKQVVGKVEKAMVPYEKYIIKSDGTPYSEDELLEIETVITNNGGIDPDAIQLEHPEIIKDNFISNIIQTVVGADANVSDLDVYNYDIGNLVNVNDPTFNWENAVFSGVPMENREGENLGKRVRSGIMIGEAFVATDWYENTDYSWVYEGELKDGQIQYAWVNKATGEKALENSKREHPMFVGVNKEEVISDFPIMETYLSAYDYNILDISTGDISLYGYTQDITDDDLDKFDIEKSIDIGKTFGYNKSGLPLNASQVRVGTSGRAGTVSDHAIWADWHANLSSDQFQKTTGDAGDLIYDKSTRVEEGWATKIQDYFTPGEVSESTVVARNYPGSNEQLQDRESVLLKNATHSLNADITGKGREVVLGKLDDQSETYLSADEQDISNLLEAGDYENAAIATKKLGYELFYEKEVWEDADGKIYTQAEYDAMGSAAKEKIQKVQRLINWEETKDIDDPLANAFKIINPEVEEKAAEMAPTSVDKLLEQRAILIYQLNEMAKILHNPNYHNSKGTYPSLKSAIEHEAPWTMSLEKYKEGGYSRKWNTIKEFSTSDGLISGLSELPGGRDGNKKAALWNELLGQFNVVNRALEINADLYRQYATKGGSFVEGYTGDIQETRQQKEDFEMVMANAGFDLKEGRETNYYDDDTRFWKTTGSTTRMVQDIVVSFAATRRIPLKWLGFGHSKKATNIGQALNRWKKTTSANLIKQSGVNTTLTNTIIKGSVYGTGEVMLGLASDPIFQTISDGALVIDFETLELQPESIMFLGTMGSMSPLTQGFFKFVGGSTVMQRYLAGAEHLATKYNKFSSVTGRNTWKALGSKATEAGIGTLTLWAADHLVHGTPDYAGRWEAEHFDSEMDMREKYGVEYIKSNYIALAAMSMFSLGRGGTTHAVIEGYKADLRAYKGETKYGNSSYKNLGFTEKPNYEKRYTNEEIDNAFRKKANKIYESGKSIKEINAEIAKLKSDAQNLKFHNQLQHVNDMIKSEEVSLSKSQEIIKNILYGVTSGKDPSGKQIIDFSRLTPDQITYYKTKLGIVTENYNPKDYDKEVLDSKANEQIDRMVKEYQNLVELVDQTALQKDTKAFEYAVKNYDQIMKLNRQKLDLEGKSDPISKNKIKELNEQIKIQVEEVEAKMEAYGIEFDVKQQLAKAAYEVVGKQLGKEVEYAAPINPERTETETILKTDDIKTVETKNKEYKERIDKETTDNYIEKANGNEYLKDGTKNPKYDPSFDKESPAFHEKGKDGPTSDRIVVNPVRAKEVNTLGVEIHEIGHYIVRDLFKEKITTYKGKEYTKNQLDKIEVSNKKLHTKITKEGQLNEVISKDGIVVIKDWVNTLPKKDRIFLENEINKSYRFKDELGKIEKKEGEYYEEYLTNYLQGVKDKKITDSRSKTSKLGDVIIPRMRNLGFENIGRGKKEGGPKYDPTTVEGLQTLLNDIYSIDARGTSKYELANFVRDNAAAVAKAYQGISKISHAKYPITTKINEIVESNYKELLNEKIEGTDKNKYTKEEAGKEWKKQWDADGKGGWKETFEKIEPDLKKLIKLTIDELRIETKNGTRPLTTSNEMFAYETLLQIAGMNPNQIGKGGHFKNFDIRKKKYELTPKQILRNKELIKEGKQPDVSGFGLSGWLNFQIKNKFLDRLGIAAKEVPKDIVSYDAEGVKEIADPNAVELILASESKEITDRVQLESDKSKLYEVFGEINKGKGNQVKEIHNNIQSEFRNIDGSINIAKLKKATEGKNYKTLEGMFLAETIKLFTGGRTYKKGQNKGKFIHEVLAEKIKKGANIDKQDIEAVQPMLDKFMPSIAEYVLPEGFVTKEVPYKDKIWDVNKEEWVSITKGVQAPVESTGVPRSIQKPAYTKQEKAGVLVTTKEVDLKTGKAKDKLTTVRADENFFAHIKKPVLSIISPLREAVGIMKDGTFNTNPRNIKEGKEIIKKGVGEETKGILTLTNRMITSQSTREIMSEAGLGFEASMLRIADGKPSKSYAKGKDRITSERLLEEINLKLLENPRKTEQLIGEIKRSYETLTESQWEKFKELNDTDFFEIIEREMLAGEGNKASMGYAKLMLERITKTSNFVSDKGRVKSENKLITEGVDGKYQTAKGDKQSELSVVFRENLHPVFDALPTWMHNITGHKGPKFDGRTLIRTEAVSNVKSKLTKKQIEVMEAKLKKAGVEIDAIKDAVQMIKTNSKVKKVLEIAYSTKDVKVSEKLDLLKKYEKQIESWTEGNINLHKAILESQKILHKQGKLPTEYIFNEGRLQTNITAGKRALSTFKFMYLVNGKQVHTKAAPSKTRLGMYDGNSKKWLPKNEKGDLYTLNDYYSSKEYREWIEGWKECTEWQERFDVNKNDSKVKEAVEKKGISLDQAVEIATIKDLTFGNEHMKSNAETMVEGADYIINGNGKLDAIARDHNTFWAPNYIREQYLDKFGPKVSEKGDFRLSAYLPTVKLKNVYTYKGESALQYLTQKTNLQQTIRTLAETRIKTNIKAIENAGFKNYSKGESKKTVEETTKDIRNIDKAIQLGRLSKKRKGMSTWDFDDTLVITKSGVRATVPNPSGKPKPSRKVIFLAGGAGSGKGNVISKLGLEKQGFKIVNQDISLEWLKKNSGLPENMNDLTSAQRSTLGKLGHQARQIAKDKMMKYQGNAEGVVVDGTGGSIKAMEKLVNEFKGKGYDVSMLFVETSLETALKRNRARKERSLLDKIVEKNHEAVQGNKPGFKTMFSDRFMEVKTDKLKQEDAMPTDLVSRMNDFVSGYEKIRLDAEQYALEGKDILDRGGKFDFSEFDVVTKGEKGPFFQKALERVKKFGPEGNFILTARPPEAQVAIHEFLKSQGLDIPLENIKGLGNSTAEAKAMWMLEKFSEGYNDMYFADDAIQNVEAVKRALGSVEVRSKVVQAKSKNEVKDVDKLDSPNNYRNIKYSKSHRNEYEKTISKYRPDLVKEGKVSQTIDAMFTFVDSLNIPGNKKRKYEQITTKWLATSNIKLVEDRFKITDAVNLAERHKEDIFSYRNPNEIIEKYAGRVKEKVLDPKKVKKFSPDKVLNKKHGLTIHEVENTKEGQQAVRDIIDSHWGENSNPWCLTQAREGKLTEDAWINWRGYEDGPKSIIFQNGRLLSFKANGRYWDRMDNATDAPVVQIKEGRVTKKVELVPMGKGKFQEFVMETRTVSKDKKTVTTEYVAETMDGFAAGTKIVENRVNGITVKSTRYGKNGELQNITEFSKDGKATASYIFEPGGRMTSVNTYGKPFGEMGKEEIVLKKGDRLEHEIKDGKEHYFYGEISLEAQGIKRGRYTPPTIEIGWKMPEGKADLKNVIKTIDGKVRIDLEKVLEIDPNVQGLPKEVKPQIEGVTRNLEPIKKVLDQLDIKSDVQQTKQYAKGELSKDFNQILEEVKGIGRQKIFSEGRAKQEGARKGVWKWWGSSGMEDFQGLITYAFAGKGKKGEGHKKFFEDNLQKPYNRAYNEIHSMKQTMSNDYTALRKSMPEVTKQLRNKVDGTVYTVENAIRTYLWNKAGYEVPGMSKRDVRLLDNFVKNNEQLTAFAEMLSSVTKLKEGYVKPKDYWLAETITGDLQKLADGYYRDLSLTEFKENRKAIFGEWKGGRLVGDNINKIEAVYGTKHRENIESMLWAMETGQNRPYGTDAITNKWMNWINNAGGTIMFFNVKSAALQTISNLNYMNGTFNNPLRAGMAFANLPQYIKDFSKIFNSDMLLQRRAGLKINIEASELTDRLKGKSNKAQRTLSYLLEKGFIPTKYADSFAIAMGGATYYRNRIKDLIKRGYSKAEAEKLAWIDFTEITEATQQSSRPDFISAQQRSAVGRPILMFGNTPMQMFRRHKRRIQDISNNRGNMVENILSSAYYGVAQTAIFSFLTNAMFAKDEDDLEKEESDFNEKKDARFYETIIDSYLRGMGIMGAVPAALKNGILEFMTQNEKDHNADYDEVIFDLLNVSPPIGSKVRKLSRAGSTWLYNKEVVKEMGFDIDNPIIGAGANVISALTNVPLDRLVLKLQNLRDASNNDYKTWERIALGTGVNRWSLGLGEKEAIIEVEEKIKEKKKIEAEIKKEEKKRIKLREKYPDKSDEEIEIEVKSKELFDLSKQEQIDLLKSLDLSNREIKKLKKEKDRTDKIAELYKDNNKLIDDALETSKTKPKEKKVKKEKVKLSKSEKYKKSLFKMKKQDQINRLMELGYPTRKIYSLRYEKDRVEMIIKLESKKSK